MKRGGGLDVGRIRALAAEIKATKGLVRNIVVVTSGAIVAGMDALGIRGSPHELSINMKQACAAIGQPLLMSAYYREFSRVGLSPAQILVTQEDFGDRAKHRNLLRTLKSLFDFGAVPVMNENDTLAVHELKPLNKSVPSQLRFGDNDRLSAIVATEIGADLLIMLTDVEGVYVRHLADPRARLVKTLSGVPREVLRSARGGGRLGTGGMRSKLMAARLASAAGVTVVVSNGLRKGAVRRAVQGNPDGTLIVPRSGRSR